MEQSLTFAADSLRLLLEALSVGTVFVGLLMTLRQGTAPWRGHRRQSTPLLDTRLVFGQWLSLALEFQLGADIVATTANTTTENLIQLSVVAVIRTLLNLFLGREMEAQLRLQQERVSPATSPR